MSISKTTYKCIYRMFRVIFFPKCANLISVVVLYLNTMQYTEGLTPDRQRNDRCEFYGDGSYCWVEKWHLAHRISVATSATQI
jgi:hypothetical protein